MSDDEIRDLLDLGVQDPGPREELSAEQLWSAGRRQRNRGRAWLGGLGAAAAAASILGIVWAQGLAGGDAAPPPADETPDTIPGPTVEVDTGARGEPFFARFESPFAEHAEHLSGASRPATLEDLQGTWDGPDGETFVFEGDQLTATIGPCSVDRGTVELTAESRLQRVGAWDQTDDLGDCTGEAPAIPWAAALSQEPLLSMDGGTLIISGLDGTTEEPRVPVALTLGQVDENGFTWADVPARTGITPITLGRDFALTTSGASDEAGLSSIHEVMLQDLPYAAHAAQDDDVELGGYAGTCPLEMESSLRSDGVLLAGAPAPFSGCAEGSGSYQPPAEPSPAVVALLRSGPTIGFDGEAMIISGTIPESLLDTTAPPVDDTAPTSEPAEESADPTEDETGAETPAQPDDIPLMVGTPRVIVMSEGEWAPTGKLTPLTEEAATGRRWLPVTTESEPPEVGADPNGDRGLSFDGTTWRIRDCGIDIRVRGELQDGLLTTTGEAEVMPDPDPGAACVFPLTPQDWEAILTSEPWLSTDGEILVIAGGTDDTRLESLGLALLADGVDDPQGGPTEAVTLEDLAAGLVEVPDEVAAQDVGVPDVRDPQPGHVTRLSVEDGVVTVDVGCAEPLRGPAWFSHVGPEDTAWQLTAALPAAPGCDGAAADDAELWRQLLAHGTFLHHFGDYVILDAWADPSLAPPVTP